MPSFSLSCLSSLAPSVRRAVICVSRAFCSTDNENRETARSLGLPIHTCLEVMSSEMHVFAVNQPLCCTTRVEGRKYIHPRSHVVVLRYGGSNKHRAHLCYLWPWLKLYFAVDKANRLCYWRIDHEPDRSNLRTIDPCDRVTNYGVLLEILTYKPKEKYDPMLWKTRWR